jgi:hypothetical protein
MYTSFTTINKVLFQRRAELPPPHHRRRRLLYYPKSQKSLVSSPALHCRGVSDLRSFTMLPFGAVFGLAKSWLSV